jgi:diguanylate cyclase (GGDEF)-like protein
MIERGTVNGYPDAVVEWPDGSAAILTPAKIFQALAGRLASQALHDPLTGLPNRELFFGHLHRAAAGAAPGTVVVFFMDMDGFKHVNDELGHNAGDRLLQHVATRLAAAARPGDLLARLAGDEFVVLLEMPASRGQREHVAQVAERLLAAVEAPLELAGRELRPRISIGAAIAAAEADGETLMREADLAMYRAKRAGGNAVVIVDQVGAALRSRALGALEIDNTLSEALALDQFQVHYQPIVDLASGRTVSLEALVRWAHPTAGLRGPGEFLPVAERTGFIIELGAWVLDEACRQLAEWDRILGTRAPAGINVNLAIRQLADPGLVAVVERALERHDLAPERLTLELPEGATIEELAAARAPVRHLRTLGVRFTLDDLGTGASTLRHLNALTVDGIKVDQSFVAGMLTQRSDHAVVRLLVDLGQTLGIPVTAEGVETAEQLDALREAGCSMAQGYYLSKPADHRTITSWIAQHGHSRSRGAAA